MFAKWAIICVSVIVIVLVSIAPVAVLLFNSNYAVHLLYPERRYMESPDMVVNDSVYAFMREFGMCVRRSLPKAQQICCMRMHTISDYRLTIDQQEEVYKQRLERYGLQYEDWK
jgi:hypothetical protein